MVHGSWLIVVYPGYGSGSDESSQSIDELASPRNQQPTDFYLPHALKPKTATCTPTDAMQRRRLLLTTLAILPHIFYSWSHLDHQKQKGKELLRTLVLAEDDSTTVDKVQNLARPGICLHPLTSIVTRTALQQIWTHGSSKLSSDIHPMCTNQEKLFRYGSCHLLSSSLEACKVHQVTPHLEPLLASTFDNVLGSMALYGFNTQQSRFDLFHGHMFRTQLSSSAVLGMLFHCAEYPSSSPWNLGYCQMDSNCYPTHEEWRFRNVLWTASWNKRDASTISQSVWLLDGFAPQISDLRMDSTPLLIDYSTKEKMLPNCTNTVYEGCFGDLIGDIFNVSGVLCCGNLVK